MVKFIGPAYECFYVPNGKTVCFNSIGELETDDKEVIKTLSEISKEGSYGVHIEKKKADEPDPQTQVKTNKSDKKETEKKDEVEKKIEDNKDETNLDKKDESDKKEGEDNKDNDGDIDVVIADANKAEKEAKK